MEKASEIIKYASIEQVKFYIDYTEILLVEFKKRDLDQKELLDELEILTNRYAELQNT